MERLYASPDFQILWERGRADFEDQSASTYDAAMVTMCKKAGFTIAEWVWLIKAWREKHKGDSSKALRGDYQHRTWALGINSYEQTKSASKPAPATGLITTELSSVKPKKIRWLWKNRIALGKLTLIAGDPIIGKSTLTLSLASTVATGGLWPVDKTRSPKGKVLVLNAEDDLDDIVVLRLNKLGADLSYIEAIQWSVTKDEKTNKEGKRTVSLVDDIEKMEAEIKAYKGVKTLIIDPVSAFMAGVDSHKNTDVRSALAPVRDLANKYKIAIVVVTHLNKGSSTGSNVLYRTTGSLAFTAAARAVHYVIVDPDDETRRILIEGKNNLAEKTDGLAYRLISEKGSDYANLVWEEKYETRSAAELMSQSLRTKVEEASMWLEFMLKNGSQPVGQKNTDEGTLRCEADAAGFSWATMRRAKIAVKAYSKKVHNVWHWVTTK